MSNEVQKPLSLRQGTIKIMKDNPEMSMDACVILISAGTGMDLKKSANYYRWCVKEGMAPGYVPGSKLTPKKPQEKSSIPAPEKSDVPAPRKDEPIILNFAQAYIKKGWTKPLIVPKSAPPKDISNLISEGIKNGDVKIQKIPKGAGGNVQPKKGKKAA